MANQSKIIKTAGKTIHTWSTVLIYFFLLSILLNTGCKLARIPEQAEIKYDIQGEWEITMIEFNSVICKPVCSFVGTKKKGTAVPSEGTSGVYKVGGEHGIAVDFYFRITLDDGQKVFASFQGNFIDENYMEGTGRYKEDDTPYPFYSVHAWGAHRITGEEAGN